MGDNINQRIQQVIKYSGLTRNNFAKQVGTSSAVISHIVSERNKPNIDLIYKLAHAFPNVNIEWLLLRKGNMVIDGQKHLHEEPETSYQTEKKAHSNQADIGEQLKSTLEEGDQYKTHWPAFLSMLEQMLDSQRLSYKSMEQQVAAQQQVINWLKQMLK